MLFIECHTWKIKTQKDWDNLCSTFNDLPNRNIDFILNHIHDDLLYSDFSFIYSAEEPDCIVSITQIANAGDINA